MGLTHQVVKNRAAGRPTLADAAEIREVILSAAMAEFNERGFHGGSIANIALRSGVSRMTIYKQFSTKEQLLEQLLEHSARRLRTALAEIIRRDQSCRNVLLNVGRFFRQTALFFDSRAITRILVIEADRLPDLALRGLDLRRTALEPLTDYLADLISADVLNVDDASRAAEQFLHLTASSVDYLFGGVEKSPQELEEWLNEAVNTFLHGAYSRHTENKPALH